MARNVTRSGNSAGGFGQQPDTIGNGVLILLLGVAAWGVTLLLGSGIWQCLAALLAQPPA
ncbi:hypothetical protein [Devosia ginsengisoli]|uniref:Uncharacterized protein n=1 Tax=Devosia ginsengisoli TaxID=400770 RepID=A0A5B8LUI0_9HYPH|nr:hypothetical protein [Devosia ginsengisoli]QDZ11425.1 hypothetical protein FPZ08_12015 [Devosia ginsengisoli]